MPPKTMPFTHTRNVYAVGRNYLAHASELNNPVPERPLLFEKAVASLTTGDQVALPKALFPIHHELEVVLEVGIEMPPGNVTNLYCLSRIGLGIDFTAREMQEALKKQGHPWLRAKSFHNSAYVTARVPIHLPWQEFAFQLFRNGEIVQKGQTSRMLFSPLQLLQELNQTLSLSPGDLIFTGTPSGVGPVEEGDVLRLVCEHLDLDQSVRITAF